MIEVVVFGKPKSFESYAFDFGDSQVRETENSHHEPIVKPIDYNDIVFHYYQKDDIAGWEVYRRCKGYDAERPGIIFGVGIKSDKDFGLIDTMGNLLKPLWEDFAQAFLDKNYKFQFESIVNALKTTKWSPEEEEKVRNNVSKESIKTANQEKPLLLLTIENPNEIKTIEDIIKEYNDVYIASNADIFKNFINKDVLAKQANNEIYTVKDGKIEPLQKYDSKKPTRKDEQEENKSWITWIWGGKGSNSSSTSGDKNNPKIPSKLIAAVTTIAIIIAILCFIFKPKPADKIKLAEAPTTGYIFDGFNLQPTLYHGNSKRTSIDLKDITWKIEGDGERYIRIMDNNEIAINPVFNTEKPRQDQSVTIIAYYKERELGRETYTLGKYVLPKANKVDMFSYPNPIKESFKIAPKLSFNGDQDVSTKIEELRFKVEPEGFAKIDNEYRLVVTSRPENDTPVTVTAYLDKQQIGLQTYTIAKKETTNVPNPSVNVDGKILCGRRSDADNSPFQSLSTFSVREIINYNFFALDKDNKKLIGQWKCIGYDLQKEKLNQNPVNFAKSPNPGNYTLEYWVGKQKRASINITITEQ